MKDELVYLQHMLDTARRIQTRIAAVDEAQFMRDEDLQIIVTHFLQIIGEAARFVTESTRHKMDRLPWNQITGMRHRIVHDYLDVDIKIVWETAINDVPQLIAAIEDHLKRAQP